MQVDQLVGELLARGDMNDDTTLELNRILADWRAGKLCAALGITKAHDGLMLDAPPFSLKLAKKPAALSIGKRIGITKAVDIPWRFGVAGSRYLSKPFPAA